MNERENETVERRKAAADNTVGPESAYVREGRRRRKNFGRLVPLLVMLVIAFLIAREEVALVNEWSEKTFDPDAWLAKNTCQQAALNRSENRQYARVLKPGELHETQDGLYIDRLVLGEMGASGAEERVEYSCYLDAQGRLHRLNRISSRE